MFLNLLFKLYSMVQESLNLDEPFKSTQHMGRANFSLLGLCQCIQETKILLKFRRKGEFDSPFQQATKHDKDDAFQLSLQQVETTKVKHKQILKNKNSAIQERSGHSCRG